MVHFCPVHFRTVSSKPNSLSLLSTSSRHRFDFLFCREPLCTEEQIQKERDSETETEIITLSILRFISDSLRISACVRAAGSQPPRRAELLTPFTPKRHKTMLRGEESFEARRHAEQTASVSGYPLAVVSLARILTCEASNAEIKPDSPQRCSQTPSLPFHTNVHTFKVHAR